MSEEILEELTTRELSNKVRGLRYMLYELCPKDKLELVERITKLEQQLAEVLLQAEYARDSDPSVLMDKLKAAEEKAAEQGRYAVDMFDESKRAQKSEREAIIRADRAEAKLTKQDKLLDECGVYLKHRTECSSRTLDVHGIPLHKCDCGLATFATKLRDRKK